MMTKSKETKDKFEPVFIAASATSNRFTIPPVTVGASNTT